jgi:hypothetical protein
MMRLRNTLLKYFFSRWGFLRPQAIPIDSPRDQAFEGLWQQIQVGDGLDYQLPYPKEYFTRWLVTEKEVLLHGSNRGDIEELAPRSQTNYRGKHVEGVFASSDGIWPFFFATINYQNPDFRSTRNGCFTLGEEKYYCFNISEEAFAGEIWTQGWIYVLPREGFGSQDPGGVWRDEWVCPNAVAPLAVLPVETGDFPFRDKVVGFQRGESVLTTWRMYGRRGGN